MGAIGFNTSGQFQINGVPRSFGSHNAYNLINGGLSLANSVITNGFATTLYTGNGTTQSVVTDVDMATQWGNDATETFGGLVWTKNRSNTANHILNDTVRGVTKAVSSSTTDAESTNDSVTSFLSTGFNIGTVNNVNTNTYASWVFQTTHRITGTTNHGKPYTCHYNPFTGFTIVKYEGSGIAGHEIPHHLGRKLGFSVVKNLTQATDWMTNSLLDSNAGILGWFNKTDSMAYTIWASCNDSTFNILTQGTANQTNTSANQYIMYGWANSYFDESNTLIGNYEIGIYQGTGAAGNKVTTRGKPAWVMIKRLDSTGNWNILDNSRGLNADGIYETLAANVSNAEALWTSGLYAVEDGVVINATGTDWNTSGGQYLYMVVYDNDSGSGKSKYPRATDTSTLNLNATIPFANGIDASGAKNSILSKNETVSGLTFTEGKNYVYIKNDGTYGVDYHAPRYGDFLTRAYAGESPAVYKPNENKWYNSSAGTELVTNGTFNTDVTGWTKKTIAGVDASAYISWSSGKLLITSAAIGDDIAAVQTLNVVAGKKYKVSVDVMKGSDLTYIYLTNSISDGTNRVYANYNASGRTTFEFIAQVNTPALWLVSRGIAGNTSKFDDVSVFEADIVPTTPITESRNYLDAIVYADAGGQPTYVEQLPKTEYKEDTIIKNLAITGNFELGQTWKYYTNGVDRFQGAIYTNTTGKPILVTITGFSSTEANAVRILVNGQIVQKSHPYTTSTSACVMALVPNGATYSTYAPNGYSVWAELR